MFVKFGFPIDRELPLSQYAVETLKRHLRDQVSRLLLLIFGVIKAFRWKVSYRSRLTLKILFISFLVFQIVCFAFSPVIASEYHRLPPQLNIQADNQGVNILAKDYPLGKLLQAIHKKTGMQFRVPEPLNSVPVNARILARDWKSALKKLFRENSRFEKWGKNLATSKIWLYEYEDHPVSSEDFIVLVDAKESLSKYEILRLSKEATDVEKRLMAVEHFSYLGDDIEVLSLLLHNLKASEAKIRSTSLSLLKNLTEPIPLATVGEVALSDNDPQIRREAISLIIERVEEEDAKPYLLQALNDPSMENQILAQELLVDLGFSDT